MSAALDGREAVAAFQQRGRLVEVRDREEHMVELDSADGGLRYEGTCSGATTGSWTLQGKSIQRSVRRQTYEQRKTDGGFS